MRPGWKSRMFYKYLFSYLLIFLFPLIVLGYMMYGNAVVNLQNEIKDSNLNKLKFVKDALDGQIKGFRNTAVRIALDPLLTPFAVKNNSYNAKEAITRLQNYKDNSYMLDDVMLYFRGESSIYSVNGMHSISTLTRSIYQFQNWQEDAFYSDLNTLKKPTIRPAEFININNNETRRVLSYLFPIPVNSASPIGTVLFLVRESTLTNPIEQILGKFDGTIIVWDENHALIAAKSKGLTLTEAERARIIEAKYPTGIHDLALNRTNYSLATVTSEDTGWTFSIVMPTDQFLERVVEVKTLIFYVLLLILLIGLTLSAVLSAKNYRPIRDLSELVRKVWGKPGEQEGRNELEMIHRSVNAGIDMNRHLLGQIDHQRPMVRKLTLQRLLKVELHSQEELEPHLSQLQASFSGNMFYVMLIQADESGHAHSESSNEQLQKLVNVFRCGNQSGYGVELIAEHVTAVIMSAPGSPEDGKTLQKECVAHLRGLCTELGIAVPTIAVGKVCTDLLQVHRSFIEAWAALEDKVRKDKGSVIFFDEMYDQESNRQWYSTENQMKLVHGIKQGNDLVALEALDRMLAEIKDKGQPLYLLKCSCFDVINTILKTMSEIQLPYEAETVQKLAGFRTMSELHSLLRKLVSEICRHSEQQKESKNSSLADGLLRFIHEHYLSSGFSLEGMAAEFNHSAAYISRFFKDQTGQTFTDYVGGLRMQHFKNELIFSQLPVKDIVTRCGYLDVPSFLRKFKKLEGITPGEYRKLHAGGQGME